MRKTFVYLATSAIMALSLASCGGNEESSSESNSATSGDTTSATTSAASFDTSKAITLYTRDTTSGTRDGFFTKIGLESAKTDNSVLSSGIVEVTSNGDMAQKVKNDAYGIGYISLTSLASSGCKGLTFEGVEPTEANVKDGSYKLTRNFNYIVRDDYATDDKVGQIVSAFVAYMGTKEGLGIIVAAGGIVDIPSTAESWSDIAANYPIASEDNSSLTVKFGGSTSVEKMAKQLTAAFSPLCGNFIASHNHTGSGAAYTNTQGDGKDSETALDVGFLSRDLKLTGTEPAADGTYGTMCIDAIVTVVNEANPYSATTAADLVSMYQKDPTITKWSDVIK
jgi:phosphate transport system substrate-binding protein